MRFWISISFHENLLLQRSLLDLIFFLHISKQNSRRLMVEIWQNIAHINDEFLRARRFTRSHPQQPKGSLPSMLLQMLKFRFAMSTQTMVWVFVCHGI